jgi:hypothetical protein
MKKPPHAATRDGSMLLNTQQKSLYGCSRERVKNTAMSEKRKDYFSGVKISANCRYQSQNTAVFPNETQAQCLVEYRKQK